MRTSLSEAKQSLALWKGLVKAANKFGFYLAETQYVNDCEYLMVKNRLKRSIETLEELGEYSGYHDKLPIVYFEDLEDVISAISLVALANDCYFDLDRQTGKVSFCKFDKWSARDLKNIDNY